MIDGAAVYLKGSTRPIHEPQWVQVQSSHDSTEPKFYANIITEEHIRFRGHVTFSLLCHTWVQCVWSSLAGAVSDLPTGWGCAASSQSHAAAPDEDHSKHLS